MAGDGLGLTLLTVQLGEVVKQSLRVFFIRLAEFERSLEPVEGYRQVFKAIDLHLL
jgi:hypothetical protein